AAVASRAISAMRRAVAHRRWRRHSATAARAVCRKNRRKSHHRTRPMQGARGTHAAAPRRPRLAAILRLVRPGSRRSVVLKSILSFSLSRRVMVVALLLVFCGGGIAAYQSLNIEAYPNPAPPILEIIAQSPGQSAEEVERFITVPIEVAIASTPG